MSEQTDLVGGWNPVGEVLNGPRAVYRLSVRRGRHDQRSRHIVERARARGASVQECTDAELDALLPGVNHQGCILQVASSREWDEHELLEFLQAQSAPLVLFLDQVQDPHNLGACLRSAAAAGAHAVVVPKDRSAALGPAARKVSAGGAELVPLVRVTNLVRTMQTLQKQGMWIVGTVADAPQAIDQVDMTGALGLVLGGEAGGLRRLTAKHCDILAGIPMPGSIESLNVSVAAGICLFEALRQRRR